MLQALQQPSKEPFGRLCVSPRLNEDVEHDAVLIHRTPKAMLHTLYSDEHFIEVPLVAGSWPTASQAARERLAKFLAPAPDGLDRSLRETGTDAVAQRLDQPRAGYFEGR